MGECFLSLGKVGKISTERALRVRMVLSASGILLLFSISFISELSNEKLIKMYWVDLRGVPFIDGIVSIEKRKTQ